MANKLHQDEEFLRFEISKGSTSKDIAKRLRISYRLVEIYLRKFGIPHESQIPKKDWL